MKAIFFDMDGTLIDSQADLADAVNNTRRMLGLEAIPQPAVIANVGQGARYLLTNSIPECCGEDALKPMEFDELWALFRKHYAECCCSKVVLYSGVEDTLNELRRRGWSLGINTNKPRFATLKILERFKLSHLFGDAVVAGGDCVEMKPSAMPLVECAKRMGHTLGSEDWMVGDSWQDLDCAAAAGVKSAFCEFGFGQIKKENYTAKISSFSELLHLCV